MEQRGKGKNGQWQWGCVLCLTRRASGLGLSCRTGSSPQIFMETACGGMLCISVFHPRVALTALPLPTALCTTPRPQDTGRGVGTFVLGFCGILTAV